MTGRALKRTQQNFNRPVANKAGQVECFPGKPHGHVMCAGPRPAWVHALLLLSVIIFFYVLPMKKCFKFHKLQFPYS